MMQQVIVGQFLAMVGSRPLLYPPPRTQLCVALQTLTFNPSTLGGGGGGMRRGGRDTVSGRNKLGYRGSVNAGYACNEGE